VSAEQEADELDREVWGGDPVHVALSKVMRDVQAVGKTGRNETQNYSFRGIDAVLNAVGPALREHGIVMLPRVIASKYATFNTSGGAFMHEAILEMEYTFIGPGGDRLVCTAMGESADSGDKATAKAQSVALRTALIAALCIPTDEPDPDTSSYVRTAPPPPPMEKPAKHAKQDIIRAIQRDHPEMDKDKVESIAIDVWEWGAVTAEVVFPAELDSMLAHIPTAVAAAGEES